MTVRCTHSLKIFVRSISNIGHTFIKNPRNETKEKKPNVLEFVVAEKTKDTNEKIADFVTEIFSKYEPVTLAAELDETDELRGYLLSNIEAGESLLILDPKTKEIISAAVKIETKPNSSQAIRDYAESKIKSEKYKRLLYLLADISDSAKLFEHLEVDKVWNIAFLATVPKMSGSGLSEFLIRQSKKLAIKAEYPVIYMESTNYYSARLSKKVGFKCLQDRSLKSYTDSLGQPWILKDLPPPHGNVVIAYEKIISECRRLSGPTPPFIYTKNE